MSPEDYQRIEKAILYLERNFREQPELDDVARVVHLSPYHFQRLFRRWAGISPKRFLQFLTVNYAKRLLEESRSVLDATYEAGLASPGRLHDLFVSTEAVTPGQFKLKGEGLRVSYGFHPSPFGDCLLCLTERGICGLAFVGEGGRADLLRETQRLWKGARFAEDSAATGPVALSIFSPPNGRAAPPLTLFLKGTNFQIKVWEALLKIPAGAVVSYQEVALRLGQPRATRAVGTAVGQNPIAYLIPCHRVIRKMGSFGNYRSGSARKKALLAWEAARREVQTELGIAES